MRPCALAALVLFVGLLTPFEAARGDEERRVIVLGFDGVDPARVQEYMDAGDLPHLRRLAERGTFSALGTTNPAESPVSWSSFTIGANPGKTGIFDFLYRIPGTYVPGIALAAQGEKRIGLGTRVGLSAALGAAVLLLLLVGSAVAVRLGGFSLSRRTRVVTRVGAGLAALAAGALLFTAFQLWVPPSIPVPEATRDGTPFWKVAGEHRCESCILQVPVTFPARGFPRGRLLTGLGTPDLKGTWGTYTVYASKFSEAEPLDPLNAIDPRVYLVGQADTVTGGKLVHLEFPEGERVELSTYLFGPRNFTISAAEREAHPERPVEVSPPLTIALDRPADRATFSAGGKSVAAAAGEWTDWLEVEFRLNPVFRLKGIVRFRVRSVAPEFYAYASPINFHPAHPPPVVPLSAPRGYSRRVTELTGQWHETVGWAIATNPLKDEVIDEDEFLEDVEFTFERRWQIVREELRRGDWRLLVGVLLAPDRVQHMFLRYVDPEHPLYDPEAPDRYRNAIRDVYRSMDEKVGWVLDNIVDEDTDLYVISDHGFASYRKGVHINSWLIQEGFMVLEDPESREHGKLADITRGADPFDNVDWSRTRAYSLGLGKIYLNRRGREPQGILDTPEEVERTLDEVISRFEAFRDPDDGRRVVRKVYKSREVFRGPHTDKAADLVVGFEKGYRVSWDTAAGKAPPGVVEINRNKWSGDHCSVDPSLVPGFIVTNRKLAVDDPQIVDMARTVLETLGAPPPPEMEGRNLLP